MCNVQRGGGVTVTTADGVGDCPKKQALLSTGQAAEGVQSTHPCVVRGRHSPG